MMMKRFLLSILILGVCLLSAGESLLAQPPVIKNSQLQAAQEVAKRVLQIEPNAKAIFVREFHGKGDNNAGLAKIIGEALAASGLTIERGADIELSGNVLRFPLEESRPLQGFTIRSRLLLANAMERSFEITVFNADEGQVAIGTTGETAAPPDKPAGSKPEVEINVNDSVIRPALNSPYGVEILVERNNRYLSLKPVIRGANATVMVQKGDIIIVRLYNDSDYEAGVSVMIDGLSRFAMADDPKKQGFVDIVGSRKIRDIKGYFRDAKVVDAFQVGEYSKSPAAKKLPDAKPEGAFTIAFRAAWTKNGEIPPNEPPQTKGAGIERGPERADPTVEVERSMGAVRAIVKVFYEETPQK